MQGWSCHATGWRCTCSMPGSTVQVTAAPPAADGFAWAGPPAGCPQTADADRVVQQHDVAPGRCPRAPAATPRPQGPPPWRGPQPNDARCVRFSAGEGTTTPDGLNHQLGSDATPPHNNRSIPPHVEVPGPCPAPCRPPAGAIARHPFVLQPHRWLWPLLIGIGARTCASAAARAADSPPNPQRRWRPGQPSSTREAGQRPWSTRQPPSGS
jgi:hypothetical protein